jgi:hypothetical protein
VGDLAAAEHDRHLDAVPAEQEALDVALLGVVVVLGDLRPELDLADRDLLLVLAGGLLLLGLLVLELRVVEDPADGRARVRSDLDEIEIALLRVRQCLGRLDDASDTRMRSFVRVRSRSGGRRSNRLGTGTSCVQRPSGSSGAAPCRVKLDQRE